MIDCVKAGYRRGAGLAGEDLPHFQPGSDLEPSPAPVSAESVSGRRWVLGLIVLIALLRGLFWVALTEVPNPIDEIHHLAYIDSIASGGGIPIVGEDFLPRPILQLMRDSPTFGSRRHPLDPGKPEMWGPSALQYESVQPAFYYGLMVPAYEIGSRWGVLGSLYAVRIASLLLALTAIPLTWMLARELFPDRREIWALSALLLAILQGFNGNLASASNDALVLPLAAASALIIVRTVRRPTWRGALLCGLAIGLSMLAKLNAVGLLPLLGIALLMLPRLQERLIWWRLRWGALAAATAAVVVSPWFAWNQYAYGKLGGGSDVAAEMLAALQVTYEFGVEGVISHLTESMSGFWQFQRYSPRGPGPYGWIFVAAAALAFSGILVSLVKRRRDQAARLGWLAACWPVMFLAMLAIVYLAYTGTIVGRHTYPALVPLLVFLAGGILTGLGPRAGTVVLALLIASALWLEQAENKWYMDRVYLEHVFLEGVSPHWDQPMTLTWVEVRELNIDSTCPAVVLGLGFAEPPPLEIAFSTDRGVATAPLVGLSEGMSLYLLEKPYPKSMDIRFDPPRLMGLDTQKPGPVKFSDGHPRRSPMSQIQCRVDDPQRTRFEQRYAPFHPGAVTYGRVLAWGRGWAVLGILFAGGVVVTEVLAWRSSRRAIGDDTEP